MYRDQPVMEADGEFVRRIGFVLDPISRVIKRLAERNFDQMGSNSKIASCCPVFSGPAPDPLKHARVKALEKIFSCRHFPAAKRPSVRGRDVLLFEFVQFTA